MAAMQLRNCVRCGRLFASVGRPVCPECLRKEQEEFQQVRDYLANNASASFLEVTEATGVSADRIRQWVREGRLVLPAAGTGWPEEGGEGQPAGSRPEAGVVCQRCGRPIAIGRLCPQCAYELGEEMRRSLTSSRSGQGRGAGEAAGARGPAPSSAASPTPASKGQLGSPAARAGKSPGGDAGDSRSRREAVHARELIRRRHGR